MKIVDPFVKEKQMEVIKYEKDITKEPNSKAKNK